MIYVVKSGDTVDKIAQEYNIAVDRLTFDNQIPYPYRLAVGQALYISEENANLDDAEKSNLYVNGYAYPFINAEVLNMTLPYLTDLSVFSYGFTREGTLIPPQLDEQWMIEAAWQNGVNPILTLTPLDERGMFNNNLISSVVNSEEARSTLISEVEDTLYEKGFAGVDIDFEYILQEDRDAFTEFVRIMTDTLNLSGYQVSVALAPKISDEQQGLLYQGKDYSSLGEAANHVLLMTYEWGYTYGPPMAVAPINKVREVVEYAVTRIDTGKINMGTPNYGYDWPLPYERGVTKARVVGNIEAVEIAISKGVDIQFDETAKSPYFRYNEDGVEHEVWFEDVRSINEKFNLVREYGLRGVGYWQIMRLFRANWLLLAEQFRIA